MNESPKTAADAFHLLYEIKATKALIRHAELVLEAAELLLDRLAFLGIPHLAWFVRVGAVLHDVGKISHPDELTGGGNLHEEAGQALLLSYGVTPLVARVCVTHAQWNLEVEGDESLWVTFEEMLIALADRLWKGRRDFELEKRVIAESATRLEVNAWDLFVPLDTLFEAIAAGGHDRLERSRV